MTNKVHKTINRLRLAGCVILDGAGRVLLIHRNTSKRAQWELPGGKIETNETPEDAAQREIKEELGIDVSITKKLGEQSFLEDGFDLDYLWYLASVNAGLPSLQEEKFDDLKYFSWTELQEKLHELSPNTQNLVNAYLRNSFFLS